MRYLPDLIPTSSRVLPGYFKGHPYAAAQKSGRIVRFLAYLGACFFFLMALGMLPHPAPVLLFGAIGVILLPPGRRALERALRFRMTATIQKGALAVLFVSGAITSGRHAAADARLATAAQANQRRLDAAKAAADGQARAAANRRADSFNHYFQKGQDLAHGTRQNEALALLDTARRFSAGTADAERVRWLQTEIRDRQTDVFLKKGKYRDALPGLGSRLARNAYDGDARYKRALCYSKTGQTKEAVADLKIAMEQGSEQAGRLYEKINPVRRRVIDYITRCCDGTASPTNAKGRGACSHHGGVCDWNEPVYEEYRTYE